MFWRRTSKAVAMQPKMLRCLLAELIKLNLIRQNGQYKRYTTTLVPGRHDLWQTCHFVYGNSCMHWQCSACPVAATIILSVKRISVSFLDFANLRQHCVLHCLSTHWVTDSCKLYRWCLPRRRPNCVHVYTVVPMTIYTLPSHAALRSHVIL